MIVSIAVKASVRCPSCSIQVPVNGLYPRASCPGCGGAFAVEGGRAWWTDKLVLDSGVGCAVVAARPEEEPLQTQDVDLTFVRSEPACPSCGEPIAAARVAPAIASGACACAACGGSLAARPPEESWRARMPWLLGLAGETPAAVVEERAGKASALICPACGAELPSVSGERLVRCEYCHTTSLTPDPLAPARRREWFWLIVDADERTAARWSFKAIENEEVSQLEAIASNPETPPWQLEILAEISWVNREVASNPSTPEAALVRLASAEHSSARAAVARHPRTPAATIDKLASDEDDHVRAEIAERAELPAALALRLSRDPEARVRWKLAERADLGEEVLLVLAADADQAVQGRVASSPRATAPALAPLAASPEWTVREAIAKHPAAGAETLARLAVDQQWHVRIAVAKNPATPEEVLGRLAWKGDPDDSVTTAARANPSCPAKPWWKKLLGV